VVVDSDGDHDDHDHDYDDDDYYSDDDDDNDDNDDDDNDDDDDDNDDDDDVTFNAQVAEAVSYKMKAKITDVYILSHKTQCVLIFGGVVDVGAGKLRGLPVLKL
jgi:hypothetical protein